MANTKKNIAVEYATKAEVAELQKALDMILAAVTANNAPAAKAPAKGKSSGTVKNSKKATKMTVNVVDGTGRGAGQKFIAVTFDGKPSDSVLVTLKGNGFKYFAPTKTWSCKYSKKAMGVAENLIK